MTLTFEFGFGRLVEGLSWSTMLADYDVTSDRIWVLVPLWTAAVVAVVHSLQGDNRPREGRSRANGISNRA